MAGQLNRRCCQCEPLTERRAGRHAELHYAERPPLAFGSQLDVINHCSRVLRVDKANVKALYRRAVGHLMLPSERHINGLALAQQDLSLAHDLDPENAEV